MRSAYIETLYDLADKDTNVYAVISDNGAIVYDKFRADFPGQFINAGISEANMVGMAAGMAERRKIPFAYTIGAFLAYRAYEFILNDVCLQNMNVKLVGIGAGCSYSLLGASHHSIYDLAVLRPLPNLTLLSPASPLEVKKAVRAAYETEGPVYIRLGTNREPEIYDEDYDFCIGRAVWMRRGKDITIISTGSIVNDVMIAANELEKQGISAGVINMHTISPFDQEAIVEAAECSSAILTVEEHSIVGGLASAVAEVIAEKGLRVSFGRIGLYDFVHGYGKHPELKESNGIGQKQIIGKTVEMVGRVDGVKR